MPSIGQPYTVTVLPGHKSNTNTSNTTKRQRRDSKSDSSFNSNVAISCKSSRVSVGIDKSGILAFHLKPSLRQLQSIALSPSTRVVAVSPYTVHSSPLNKTATATTTIYACTEERGQMQLECFQSEREAGTETFSRHIDTTAQYIFPIQDRVHGDYVVVASSSCLVTGYSMDLQNELWTLKPKASRSLLFAHFNAQGFLFLVARRDVGKKSILEVYKIAIGYSSQDTFQVSVFEIDGFEDVSLFAFGEGSSTLYRLVPHTMILMCYDVTNARLKSELRLNLNNKEKQQYLDTHFVSFVTVGDNNHVLVSLGDRLCLVDVKYGSLIAELDVDEPLKLITSMGSAVIALSKTHEVQAMSIDTGLGNLFESLGKACVQKDKKTNNWDLSFIQLPTPKPPGMSLNEYNAQVNVKLERASQANQVIIDELETLSRDNKTQEFQDAAFKIFCRPQQDDNNNNNNNTKTLRVYDGERDHSVDYGVMNAIVNMIFRHDRDNKSLCKEFLPERLMVYLLTHPLFPTPEISGLIDGLSPYPRLVRQALVTCPSLSLKEIIGSGLQHFDDEVFIDAVNRLVEEFGVSLTGKDILGLTSGQQEIKRYVDRMFRLRVGWEIIPSFLDAGGILGWGKEIIDDLSRGVEEQVEILEAEQGVLTLLNESVRKISSPQSTRTRRRSVSSTTISPQVMVGSDTKLQSALALDKSSTREEGGRKQLAKRGQAISRKVQTYSVEKLVL